MARQAEKIRQLACHEWAQDATADLANADHQPHCGRGAPNDSVSAGTTPMNSGNEPAPIQLTAISVVISTTDSWSIRTAMGHSAISAQNPIIDGPAAEAV